MAKNTIQSVEPNIADLAKWEFSSIGGVFFSPETACPIVNFVKNSVK